MVQVNKKYKPCCGRICGLGGCQTQEDGGCYCLCRLKDKEQMLLSLLDGTSYQVNGAVIYEPGRVKTPAGGFFKENYLRELEKVRERIKTYEI